MAKPKRRAGRPTKTEAIIASMETAMEKIDERSSKILLDMFQVLEDIAYDAKQVAATRASAARYIIARSEDRVNSHYEEISEDSNNTDTSEDYSAPLISSKYIPPASPSIN